VLHGIQRQSQSPPPLSPLRWACCSRGCAVSYRSRGRPPNPFSLSRPASPVRLATLLSVHCLCLCCNSHTCLHSVSMRRRIILPYSRIHQRPGSVHALHENIHRGFVYCCSWGSAPKPPPCRGLGLWRLPVALSPAVPPPPSFAPGIAGALCKFRLCVLFVSVCNSQTCLHSV